MQRTFETEVLGQLTKEQFDRFKHSIEKKLGPPKQVKRLSMQITDYAKRNLDTRIRITNGAAEIMQKVGDWDAKTREEISVQLLSIPDEIYGHWQILDHMLDAPAVQKRIIQMDSYLFITPRYEIKLTHQSGVSDVYNFEVESFQRNVDPIEVCNEFELKPDLEPKSAEYWEEFNEQVNLNARKMKDEEILQTISFYCEK
ncbi:MAG TPA: hypothetical protein VJ843_04145 [Candidatus Saccharimonadales bacterium]|nr:hypothetical protein [Candidatus Saccharimonadales bacterium]